MSNVDIKIAAEFVGKKAFKQADTATQKLTKDVRKLAGAFGIAFGTQQVIAFGRRSVKAFADSELEATRLTTAVTNLGLAFAAPEIDRYIDNVELATGVNRDLLQPSFLTLLQTTGSLTKSQELLNLSLDVAAGTGSDVASVSQKLAQAYVGNAKGLRTLNLGLTTAELNSADFETVQKRITQLFAGQGQAAAASYVGQINKLSIASEQASEIIGKGLVDSLVILSGNTSVEELADDMLDAARNTAAFTENLANLANAINMPIKGLSLLITEFVKATDPFVDLIVAGDPSGFMKKKAPNPLSAPVAGFGGRTFYADAQKNAEAIAKAEAVARKRAAELLAIKKKQQALEAKILKDKRLGNLIDKGNLALLKGEEIFDMDKIQIAAALTSQAEALGKATNAAQVLAITQDVARLNVKQSILALDDAIAAKDEAAVIAATKKLNADIAILGALSGQSVKISDIKSILDSLKPKDLIDQANLDQALAKIRQMLSLLASMSGTINLGVGGLGGGPTGPTGPKGPVGGGTGPVGGGTGPVGGRSQAQIEQDERLQRFYKEELERRAAAERAAKAAAEAAAKAAKATTDALAGSGNKPFIPIDTGAIIDQVKINFEKITDQELAAVVEFAEAAAERADAVSILVDSITAGNAAILAANSAVGGVDVGSGATASIVRGMLGGADFGSAVRGANYAAQAAANYNITINANTVANPEELTMLIQDSIIRLNTRGDYLTTAGAL